MNNKIGDHGKVYKLTSLDEDNDHVYIGSTSSFYFTTRLCQHAEAFRNGKDYYGIFNDEGKCNSMILDTVSKTEPDWLKKLRKLERYHLTNQTGKCINIKKPCYYDENEKKEAHNKVVRRYQKTPKGQDALRRGTLNAKIKHYDSLLTPLGADLNSYLKVNMDANEKMKVLENKEYYLTECKDKFEKIKNSRNECIMELWRLDPELFPRGDEETV